MVSILPGESNWEKIGQAIGQNLGPAFTQGAQQGFQRQQGLNAVDQLQKELAVAGSDPSQILASLARAITVNPPLARAGLEKIALRKAQAPVGMGMPGQENLSLQQPGSIPQKDNKIPSAKTYLQDALQKHPNLPAPEFNPEVFGGELEPTALGMGPIPPQYSPEQISAQRTRDLQAGFEGSPAADIMEHYNDLSRRQYQDYSSAAQTHSTISNLIRASQERFRDELKKYTGISDPDDLAVAESISETPEFKNIKNDVVRAKKVGDTFNRYQAGKAAFEEASERPYFFDPAYKKNMETLREKLEPFKKYGQMDKARAILAGKGWSESEIAKITNPLPENIKRGISSLPNVNKILSEHIAAGNDKEDSLVVEQNKLLGKWENFLQNHIKSGVTNPKNQQVVTPGTSLILLRNEADKKGVSPQSFDLMLSKLVREGRIKLDDEQAREFNLMTKGIGRVKSVGEYLFGE